MTFWLLPNLLTKEEQNKAIGRGEITLPDAQLGDLGEAASPDALRAALRAGDPEAPPESLQALAEHYWRFGREMSEEDYLVVRIAGGKAFMLGEIEAPYEYHPHTHRGGLHVRAVFWLETRIEAGSLPEGGPRCGPYLEELREEPVLNAFKQYVPELRRSGQSIFKWASLILLVFEFIYFWPR